MIENDIIKCMIQTVICDHPKRRFSLEGFIEMAGRLAGIGGRIQSERTLAIHQNLQAHIIAFLLSQRHGAGAENGLDLADELIDRVHSDIAAHRDK